MDVKNKSINSTSEMFSGIAKRYDMLNHMLSLGLDITWRRKAINLLDIQEGTFVLDIATGTGDLAIESARKCPNCNIVGIDISNEMIAIGKKKVKRLKLTGKISLKTAAAENLGEFESEVFDYATVAFGVRNFSDLDKGLSEIRRVLKPGGRFLILEFSMPKVPVFGTIYRYYFTKVLPTIGGILSNRSAYKYLPDSVAEFPSPEKFLKRLKEIGFSQVTVTAFSLGTVTCYIAVK